MKSKSRQGITALAFAVASAAALGSGVRAVSATTYTIGNSVDSLIETTSVFSGATRVTAEGEVAATSGFWDYGLMDFGTSTLLPTQTNVTGINSISLNLVEKGETFTTSGVVDVYLTTFAGTVSTLRYSQTAGQPQGIGTDLTGTLFNVGQIIYNRTPTGGVNYNTTLSLSSTAQTYILNEINNGAPLRLIVAADSNTTAAAFVGSAGFTGPPSLPAPLLSLDLTTTSVAATNTIFSLSNGTGNTIPTITGSGKAMTVTFARVLTTASTATANITITNTGTDTGSYLLQGSTGTSTVATGTGTVGAEPVAPAGTSTLSVGIAPSTILAGTGPASATVTVKNHSNGADGDATITLTATQVVATRVIDNTGANATPVLFGRVLGGTTTANQTVTLDTENTNALDYTSNSLTSITLLATTKANSTLTTAPTGDTDRAIVSNGTVDVLFNDGSVTTTRQVQFAPTIALGGLYQTFNSYEGYVTLTMQKDVSETAIGAGNTTARVYVEADVYQPALVTGASSAGNTYSLTNVQHSNNTLSFNTAAGDIGARSSAQVTALGAFVAQAGWSRTLANGTTIADGATVAAATFDPTAKWNGTYGGNMTVTLQNDQTLTGAKPNDLGNTTFALSTVVTGNSGIGPFSVNVLPGQSFAGYSIPSGTTSNTKASLLGGTSTAGNTVSVTFTPRPAGAISDRAALSDTANDVKVIQLSYNSGVNSAEPALVSVSGGNITLATVGNSDGGASSAETLGAFSGAATLGRYGVDATNHNAWAVVDRLGNFEVLLRGDANADGIIDTTDLSTVLGNLGTTSKFWNAGNFDGAATINLTDLDTVLNYLGVTVPAGGSAIVAAEALLGGTSPSSVPEPTTLGVAGLGVAGLLLRRKNRSTR